MFFMFEHLYDLSPLQAQSSREDIIQAINIAKDYHYNSVCLRPHFVAEFSSSYRLSSVIGFPSNFIYYDPEDLESCLISISSPSMSSKTIEARKALQEGALELDPVLNIRDLWESTEALRKEIQTYLFLLREFARTDTHLYLKAIFSSEILPARELELSVKIYASEILAFYEEFPELIGRIKCSYKNSSGFIKSSKPEKPLRLAHPQLIKTLAAYLDLYDPSKLIGIKASGAIRTFDDVQKLYNAASGRLTHIGTSQKISRP